MAEKLGVGTGIHELKIGDSFFQSLGKTSSGSRDKKNQGHRFTPSGMISSQPSASAAETGFLQVDDSNRGVSVTVPSSGGGQTNYRYGPFLLKRDWRENLILRGDPKKLDSRSNVSSPSFRKTQHKKRPFFSGSIKIVEGPIQPCIEIR